MASFNCSKKPYHEEVTVPLEAKLFILALNLKMLL